MFKEPRSFGQQEEQPAEQHTAPVNLDSTTPIGHYLPSVGAPSATCLRHLLNRPLRPHRQGAPILANTLACTVLGAGAISAIVAGALAMVMVVALFGGLAGAFLMSRSAGGDVSLLPATAGSTVRPKGSVADIAVRILPAVVTINVAGTAGADTGSGFVIRQDGDILTNNHVVEGSGAGGKITCSSLTRRPPAPRSSAATSPTTWP